MTNDDEMLYIASIWSRGGLRDMVDAGMAALKR